MSGRGGKKGNGKKGNGKTPGGGEKPGLVKRAAAAASKAVSAVGRATQKMSPTRGGARARAGEEGRGLLAGERGPSTKGGTAGPKESKPRSRLALDTKIARERGVNRQIITIFTTDKSGSRQADFNKLSPQGKEAYLRGAEDALRLDGKAPTAKLHKAGLNMAKVMSKELPPDPVEKGGGRGGGGGGGGGRGRGGGGGRGRDGSGQGITV